MNISDRIAELIASLGISTRAFEQKIGCSNGVIARCISKKTDISSIWVSKIIETYTDIDPRWLLIGQGEMLISTQPITSVPQSTEKSAESAVYYSMYKEKDAEVKAQAKEIGALEQQVKTLEEKILGLQHEIVALTSDNGGAQDVTIAGVG